MVDLWFVVLIGALLLGACLLAMIGLARYELPKKDDLFIDTKELFRDRAEERRQALTNDVINFLRGDDGSVDH